MEIAIAEPHFYGIHGGEKSIPHFMVVYSYTIHEFYENLWVDEFKVSFRHIRQGVHRTTLSHDIIRNYKYHLNQFVKLELVQIYEDDQQRCLCILHTYKLNIFKRIWRKRRMNRMRQL